MQMDQLRHKYDPEHYYRKASSVIATLTEEEKKEWYMHACTRHLLLTLEGDLSRILTEWLTGGLISESVDLTAQASVKALGMAQAIEDVTQHIRNIKDSNDPTEDNYHNEYTHTS